MDNSRIIGITGSSGYIGSRLVRHLEETTSNRIVAFDVIPPAIPTHNISVHRVDVSRPIYNLLKHESVNTLVHLAENTIIPAAISKSQVRSLREEKQLTLESVLDSCVNASVDHVIYVSSNTVYGVYNDASTPVMEESSLTTSTDFNYSYDKVLAENKLTQFAIENPDISVTVLRSSPVLGPTANGDLTSVFYCTHPISILGHNPPFQCIHEDDLVRILGQVIKTTTGGVFNAAGDGVVFRDEILKMIPFRPLTIPSFGILPLVLLSAIGVRTGAATNKSAFNLMKYPIVMSTARLKQKLEYITAYNSLEALTAFVNSVLWK
jgi:UDP-glucose 4-epimerase